jgi:hypothetical protein
MWELPLIWPKMTKVHDTRDFRAKKFPSSNNFPCAHFFLFKFKRLPWQEENRVDKVVVQRYLLLVEVSESFEKAELAAKEAPTDALERAATAPSRKTAKPIGARENPDGSESNQDEGATKQY